ncbi:hypothetical protein BCR36DRAFT_347197 [Piromyces finnis]|uniref:Chitin-binding type-1 domain-containing protein n=1 Tax=Piromyces finnis TaxID=1754191 RepID=A0A1Y1VG46_9FUNG|nr:hypothetical protein BCR36DRAFT_347197 [Piromyces finnis]|eukprot:ORX55397.1 hypothetical protein BCR36DRAFT_347197 [Piromyces finnis]
MYKNLFLILAFIALAAARSVKFSLIALNAQNVSVKIGSKSYNLKRYSTYAPVYQATLTVSDSELTYTYYVDNVSEGFTRTLAKGATTTHNEFLGRKDTVKTLPQLPQVYQWTKSIGKGELFDDSYIPTVHIYGDRSNKMFTSTKASADYLERIVFILKDSILTFKNIPAYPKNKSWNKFQFKVQLSGDGVEGRYTLKFRDNNEDPTFLRQDLYGDILNALGYPTIQSIKTRVYVNEKAVGYYILQEEAASESFARATFHGDNNGKLLITDVNKLGHPLDCSTGADFYYTGNTFYAFQPYNSDRYDNSNIKNLCKQFESLNVNSSSQVKSFEQNWFDIDTFFKGIAMEILTGHWDSYWLYSTNFAVYDNPTENNKYYFICQDWDGTFGLNLGMPYMRYDDFIDRSYKDFVNIEWGLDEYDAPQRYAIDKLLSNATLRARFETILKNIVVKIFNPKVLNKRIDALVERHRDEIAWNYEVINKNPLRKGSGTQLNWTMEDFETNINTASRHGAGYGIKEWVYRRAKAMNKEFGLNIDLGSETYGSDISRNGLCGPDYGRCPDKQCCSKYGYCGSETEYCTNCQAEFGYCPGSTIAKTTTVKTTAVKTTTTVKTTTRKTTTTVKKTTTTTSTKTTLPVSTDGTCGPNKGSCPSGQCCSKYGYCGITDAHCGTGCQSGFGKCGSTSTNTGNTGNTGSTVDYTKIYSTDGMCGEGHGRCRSGCCSQYGYCGTSDAHCTNNCQAKYGICQ